MFFKKTLHQERIEIDSYQVKIQVGKNQKLKHQLSMLKLTDSDLKYLCAFQPYVEKNINDIVHSLPHVVKSARFFGWKESIANACNTFCHLCMVDPMLVEAHIGKRFEKIFIGV
mgnify:CR=1 FL=1